MAQQAQAAQQATKATLQQISDAISAEYVALRDAG
jgi:hypothetical protein